MPIHKRGEVWHINITAPDGSRIRQSSGTTDRQAAQEYHDKLKAQLWAQARLGVKIVRKWDEAALKFLREKSGLKSIEGEARQIGWWTLAFRGRDLASITRQEAADLVEAAHSTPATRNRYIATLRSLLRKAEREWEWLDKAPSLRTYTEPKGRIRWLTYEEAARVLNAMPQWMRDMAEFALATGLRQANIFKLTWDRVDLARKAVFIPANQFKSGQDFTCPLNSEAVAVIRRRIGAHQSHVFTDSFGKEMDIWPRWVLLQFKAVLKEAGIEDFTWHDLRHTWASWHVQNGTSIYELKKLGGWETIEMPQRYAHLSVDHLAETAERVTNLAQRGLATTKKKAG